MEVHPGVTYDNAPERNIHVWVSALSPNRWPCLVAEPATFYVLVRRPGSNGILTPNNNHSTISFHQDIQNAIIARVYESRQSTTFIQPGEYLLFNLIPSGLKTVRPAFRSTPIKSRTVTKPTGTKTPKSARPIAIWVFPDARVRVDVRNRDRQYRVSGQAMQRRARGPNYKGLQVAHIYPLGYWEYAKLLLDDDAYNALKDAKGSLLVTAPKHFRPGFGVDIENYDL
ncbi:hypothetical protein B0H12DRAFT_1080525 [Mycena haematopus]|nr:hypothetical protein B0H12DRAFT_1080525 [Mycena haematopus]